jgi:hypothetical protein
MDLLSSREQYCVHCRILFHGVTTSHRFNLKRPLALVRGLIVKRVLGRDVGVNTGWCHAIRGNKVGTEFPAECGQNSAEFR